MQLISLLGWSRPWRWASRNRNMIQIRFPDGSSLPSTDIFRYSPPLRTLSYGLLPPLACTCTLELSKYPSAYQDYLILKVNRLASLAGVLLWLLLGWDYLGLEVELALLD